MKTWTPLLLALAASAGHLRGGENTSFPLSPPPVAPPAAAIQTKTPDSSYVSPWVGEVTKLVEANVDTGVVLEFINGAGTFGLTSPQIIALNEQGVPGEVVTAMIQHDAEYANGYRANPPAPPVRHIFLRVAAPKKPETEADRAARAAAQAESIVNPSPAPDLWLEDYFAIPEPVMPPPVSVQTAPKPVRESSPVRLTNTILVHRGPAPIPNNYTFESFPADTLKP